MKRRDFPITLLGAAAFTLPGLALAQGGPVEGRHYVRLTQPMPVSAAPPKIEVIEFFWYGCPHCAAFEPALEAWMKQLPDDIAFRRVPVAFRSEPYVAHQRFFYALDALGLVDSLQRKVFYAIHNGRQPLDKPADMAAFVEKNGGDAAKFTEAYNSFGSQAKLQQANRLTDGYKIDGVPAFGVQGRFYTSGTLAGDNDRALAVVDFLARGLRSKTI